MVEAYAIFIKEFCNTKAKISPKAGVYTFRVGGNNLAPIVLDKLYKNSKIYLDRKYEKYLTHKKMFNSNTMHPN